MPKTWPAPVGVAAAQPASIQLAKQLSHAVSLQNIQKIQRMGESPIPMGNANLPGQGVLPSELQPKLGDLKEQLQGIVSADLKGGFVGLAKIVPDCAKAIERFGTQVVEASRHLAQFSPQITYAMAQMDRQRMLQERDMARQTGGSTAFATKELMSLREQMQPMQQLSANVKNLASGIFSATAEKAMWLLNAVIKPLNEVVKWFGELLGGSDKDVRARSKSCWGTCWTKAGRRGRNPAGRRWMNDGQRRREPTRLQAEDGPHAGQRLRGGGQGGKARGRKKAGRLARQ